MQASQIMSDSFDEELKDIDHSQLRKHNRYNITTACRIFNLETNIQTETYLTTISVGGVSFVYPEIIAKGSILRIEFDMPNGSKVNRFIEIKRFEMEVKSFPSTTGQPCVGFEHGSKFIIMQKAKSEEKETEQATASALKEEVFQNCFYHMEYFRSNSSVLRHGYINRLGEKHLFFHTLAEPQLGEKIYGNIVINDENKKAEKKLRIEIIECVKESKLYLSKGEILN